MKETLKSFFAFFSDLDKGIECTLRQFADDTKLQEVADKPEGSAAIQRHLGRLKSWAESSLMRFNKDRRIECTLSQFTDDTRLGESINLLESRKALQKDLDRMARWVKANCMRGGEVTSQVVYFSHNNPKQCYRLVEERLESCPVEKDLGMLVSNWLNMIQQCA
ncbi:hypothetical protein WISP_90518 [Willisornis vidua]|uniref:Rna-directed dna polymerase from mobile element jockey-like n=1 Tax=Willisornis vidua TaxID=1566151 RepID=A0ABQ9D784_9PASS|nr:hypothetical protein WISP_90518 [Willisornis vidua]